MRRAATLAAMGMRADFRQRGLSVLVAAIATVSLAGSWPRLQASIHYLPVDTAIGKYFDSRVIPSLQMAGLIERAHASIRTHNHYRYWEGLSLLHYLRALDQETPPWERRPELRRSLMALQEVVRRAPASPRAWLRMAQVQSHLGQPDPWVLDPLRMSILTGRVEPSLLIPRLELGYRHVAMLDEETAGLLRDQTVLAWGVDRRGLIRAIRDGRLDLVHLREILDQRPGILSELEATLGADA